MKKSRYKIVNRKRFIMSISTISLLIVFIISLFLNNIAFSSTYNNNETYKEIVATEGDTLWKIAKENMPDNYDIRKMIYEIREFNNMDSADIYPGDLIKIPVIYN